MNHVPEIQILGIRFPDTKGSRIRDVVSRSNFRQTGKFPSVKMSRSVHWESRGELNAFTLLDCDPLVKDFSEEPCEIQYSLDGVEHLHYPDILVNTAHGQEFWEIKWRPQDLAAELDLRTKLLAKALPRSGYVYRLMFNTDLSRQPRLDNANRLRRFGRYVPSLREKEFVRQLLKRDGSLSWRKACNGDYGLRGREILCAFTISGRLDVDLDLAWSSETRFFLRGGGS